MLKLLEMFLKFTGLSLTQVKLIAAALIIAVLVLSGWFARGVWEDAKDVQAVRDQLTTLRESIERAEKAGEHAADAIAKIRVTNKTINNEVRHETVTREVFRNPDCTAPDSTVRVLDAALTGQKTNPGESSGAVPRPDAPFRREVRDNSGEAGGGSKPVPGVQRNP